MFTRSSGMLLPIFSLPGPWGIGCFGPEARDFARLLADAGFRYWQILPLPPTSAGDSPYQGLSAYAGNPYLLDLAQLGAQGLLTAEDLATAQCDWDPTHVDYGWLYETRENLLRKAAARLDGTMRDAVQTFVREQAAWLPDYCLFRAIKRYFHDQPWWSWTDDGLRRHETASLERFATDHADELAYHAFVQFEFARQWQALKAEVNGLGIWFIGDMPIYVAHDSSDVWSASDLFEMDEDCELTRVAGVPPDYFSADGQLWGNPLYRWDRMQADGFSWWLDRIEASLSIFDVLRIDHFRGFESYWAVPGTATNARTGAWEKGPAMHLFDCILAKFPEAPIIAEDLGDIDDAVRAFLDATGLPGMKVLQFGFDDSVDGKGLPHHFTPNTVVYSGTHDNDTTTGWWHSITPDQAAQAIAYCRFDPTAASVLAADGLATDLAFCRSFLQTLWVAPSLIAVAPAQDFLGLDSEARINTPGTPEGNWRFRLTREQMEALDIDWMLRLNETYYRSSVERPPSLSTSRLR